MATTPDPAHEPKASRTKIPANSAVTPISHHFDIDRSDAPIMAVQLLQAMTEEPMLQVQDGQCGLCSHFGEIHNVSKQLSQIRMTHEAPENLVEDCGLPRHADLHLKVTSISGCDGFEAAKPS